MRDHRPIIREALENADTPAAVINRKLGLKRNYLTDYLNKPTPKHLRYEIRMKLAKMLGIEPELLDVGSNADDGEPPESDGAIYIPPPGDVLSPQPHTVYLKVSSRAMDEHAERIEPGHIAAFDTRASEIKKLKTGRIVYAERRHDEQIDTLIRQYIAPDKLTTNSSAANDIVRVDDEDVRILGVFLYVFRGAGDD